MADPERKYASWSLYMLRSGDGSLYTGISTDVPRRLQEHRSGAAPGARALRGKHSIELVYAVEVGNRSAASRLEYRVKQLSKLEKESLVKEQPNLGTLKGQVSRNDH
ncbi:MAG: GIY-YIG nuclease family protein [Gammaproteobacteria bacterium]